jgi:hypothetical protein
MGTVNLRISVNSGAKRCFRPFRDVVFRCIRRVMLFSNGGVASIQWGRSFGEITRFCFDVLLSKSHFERE